MIPKLIPAVDAAGLPGPPWLFHVLLVFTFFLHLLFMNLTLGGTLLAWASHLLAGGRRDDPRGVLAARLTAVNTFGISLTITTGIAPLLFVQVLYHQYFYTATILIGGAWFGLLGLLTVGYYAAYLYKFRGAPARGTGGGIWLGVAAICFLLIAMLHVAVHLVHAQGASWPSMAANPWSVLGDPSYVPRLLHFVLAAIGFSAAVVSWWAVRQRQRGAEVELNHKVAAYAWKWVLWTTVLQVVDGFVLLMVLPKPVLLALMRGGAATMVPLTVGIVLAVGLLMMVARVSDPAERPALVTGVLFTLVAVVAIMSVTRHQLRILYMDAMLEHSVFAVNPQWGTFALFVVVLIAGLSTTAWMVHRVLASPATGEDAA